MPSVSATSIGGDGATSPARALPSAASLEIDDGDLTLLDADVVISTRNRRTFAAPDQTPTPGSRRAAPKRLLRSSSGGGSSTGEINIPGAGPTGKQLASEQAGSGRGATTSVATVATAGVGSSLEVSPRSILWFAHRKYRLVVCLDLSASMCLGRWWGMPVELFVDATMKYIQVCVSPLDFGRLFSGMMLTVDLNHFFTNLGLSSPQRYGRLFE